MLPVGFKRDLLGFYLNDFGRCAQWLTDGHDVGCVVSCGGFYDGFRGRVGLMRQDGAYQAVGFTRSWRCPAEGAKQVVVYDGALDATVGVCWGWVSDAKRDRHNRMHAMMR